MAPILETRDLTKAFGAVTAAASISVAVEEDSVVGLIGGNGAGKTTFVNLVTGYLKPTRGTVRFDGRDVTGLSPRRITRMGICRSFQIPQVFESMTTRDNLLVGLGVVALGGRAFAGPTAVSGRSPEEVADETLARFRLEPWRDQRASVLPEGTRKLLDIAMALAVKPRILLLDEPTSGVSADEKFALMDLVLGAVRADRVTVLFVEHDMEVVRRYTQRVLAFYEGRVIADGAPEVVFENADVRKYVVGGAAAAPVSEGTC